MRAKTTDTAEIRVGFDGWIYGRRMSPEGEVVSVSSAYAKPRQALAWALKQGLPIKRYMPAAEIEAA